MKHTLEGIAHFKFFEQLEIFLKETESLLSCETVSKEEVDNIIANIRNFINEYIGASSEAIQELLIDYYGPLHSYFYREYGIEKESLEKKEEDRLEYFHNSLKFAIRYLSVIDSLIDNSYINTIESISEKSDFTLNKLNQLFDDEDYSIATILRLNGIKLRKGESQEIAENLSKRGYVILSRHNSETDYVKISVKGASYIERKNKQKKNSIRNEELDKKIDNIIEHLVKLGCGQEIIFNEIDELKELQYKLSKKSWSQLLKGKLLDLALGKIISTETASSVYEYLTNNSLHLLP